MPNVEIFLFTDVRSFFVLYRTKPCEYKFGHLLSNFRQLTLRFAAKLYSLMCPLWMV